jgi:DNA-binding transcriptional regulator YbjK
MLRAAESILERNGIGGLTLRAAAREAGAPKNHFGSFSADVSQRASRFHPTGVAVRGSSVEEDFIRSVVDRRRDMQLSCVLLAGLGGSF